MIRKNQRDFYRGTGSMWLYIIITGVFGLLYLVLNQSKLNQALDFYYSSHKFKSVPLVVAVDNQNADRIFRSSIISNCLQFIPYYHCAVFTEEVKWLNAEDIRRVAVNDIPLEAYSVRQHQHSTVISFDDFSIVVPKTTRTEAVIELAKLAE